MDKEWIPVTERLPDCATHSRSKKVLITYKFNGLMCIAIAALERTEVRGENVMGWRSTFMDMFMPCSLVTAWMPLPKPYEGE